MLLGVPRPPDRAGLSPGLAQNCLVGGAAQGWRAAWAQVGRVPRGWAAPPTLLGPDGAREGSRPWGFWAISGLAAPPPGPEGTQPGEPWAPWSVRERFSLWGPPPSTARGQEWGTSTHTRLSSCKQWRPQWGPAASFTPATPTGWSRPASLSHVHGAEAGLVPPTDAPGSLRPSPSHLHSHPRRGKGPPGSEAGGGGVNRAVLGRAGLAAGCVRPWGLGCRRGLGK